ncbi:PD40 domain-containing protein [Modestobacter marinus]|uniref:WD40 repeat protein n=1 Tax=Modestobacter marinus TaxID=477641 RepID=A0A846LTG2_9ACTN|nr:WD40 repeat domain-containing protein [Modestobacter marinus]NIH68738.1 WD40 repeat protein [Modestobacter marinus]GGL59712.1 hypothetical protein GCM10011589_14610 [Modestobacter marinus]
MTTTTGERTAWRTEVPESVAAVSWSADDRVAVADLGGQVSLLDGRDGGTLDPGPVHEGGAFALAWQPGGDVLATGGADGRVGLVRTDRAEPGYVTVGGWVQALRWSPSGRHLAVAAGRDVVLLDAAGSVLARWVRQPSTVTDVVFSRDGSRVGCASYGGLRWFAVPAPGRSPSLEPVRVLAWQGSLLLARVTPDGRWVASGNQDASVHVWRLWSGEDAEMAGYPEKVDALAFDRTSRWMANGGTTEVHLWDFSGKGPMGRAPRTLPGHDAQVSALAWQPTGDLLASAGRDGGLAVWAPSAAGPARHRPRTRLDAGARVTGLSWRPDGSRVVAGTTGGDVLAVPA